MKEEFEKMGICLYRQDSAFERIPEIFKEPLCQRCAPTDNKLARYTSATWSGVRLFMCQKGVRWDVPAYNVPLELTDEAMGQSNGKTINSCR